MAVTPEFWRGRRVFITGHTGFKGGWLALWLDSLGAQVHGYSTAPPTDPNLYTAARVADSLASHTIGDIRDLAGLERAVAHAQPEVAFHMAAQPLVRYSYAEPIETFAVNALGTAHVLEALRRCTDLRAVVSVTTDKCYENREWLWGYRETEPLGGRDPYSASKACAELVTHAYRQSFMAERGVAVASARAGNVIGGGDWAADRLVPDFFRAADAGTSLEIRHPDATRPWQHVLEPLAGYIQVAEALAADPAAYAGAWNFGPTDEGIRPVRWILDHLCSRVPGTRWHTASGQQPHEATLLKLDSSKANTLLNWRPRWRLAEALDHTVDWHRVWRGGGDARAACLAQIAAYADAARNAP